MKLVLGQNYESEDFSLLDKCEFFSPRLLQWNVMYKKYLDRSKTRTESLTAFRFKMTRFL